MQKKLLMFKQNTLPENIKYIFCVLAFIGSFTTSGFAQMTKVSGTVTDESGTLLPGVSINVKNGSSSAITDSLGRYSIRTSDGSVTLVFNHISFERQEIPVGNRTIVNVRMVAAESALSEVVIIGYGSQKREHVTTAIASIKSEKFIKGSTTDPAQLIQGKVAGLSILKDNGNPNSSSQIILRGATTISSSTQPLVLIDGIPSSLRDVAPEDIETFDVLKDGSAAAIYGTRGTNGVILITTKKVRGETPPTLEYTTDINIQKIAKRQEYMSAQQYRELVAQKKLGAQDNGGNTDWQKEVFRTPLSQTHNLSLKGGNTNTNYIATLNYKSLQGLMKTSDNITTTYRMEANHTMFNGILKINANILGFDRRYNLRDFNYAYQNALTYNPTDPVKDTLGRWTQHPDQNNYSNPLAILYETKGLAKATNFRPYGSITVLPFEGMTLKLLTQYDVYNYIDGYSETGDNLNSIQNNRNGYASRSTSRFSNSLLEATANYTRTLNQHDFTLLGGYSYFDERREGFDANNFDFTTTYFSYNDLANGAALKLGRAGLGSFQNLSRLVSYFGRVIYNFDNRYSLQASLRYEGSSKFGADHKWGAFPSVSAGWNVINETFMDGAKDWLSNLRFRAGYGVTGTVPDNPYQSLALLNYSYNGDKFLYNGVWTPVISPKSNANPELRWERKEEINLGADVGFIQNRITATIDVYQRTTRDLLGTYNLPSPPYLFSTIIANAGSIRNRGVEASITARVIENQHFNWTTSVNGSSNKNTVLTLSNDKFVRQGGFINTGYTGEPIQTYTHRVAEGQPLGNFYGWKSIDVDDKGYWVIEGADGKPKSILDATEEDRKIIGNGVPKAYLNWNNSFSYGRFNLDINMRGAYSFQILNVARMFFATPKALTRGNVMTTAFDKVYNKRPLNDDQSQYYVSYFLENGDYWKVGNVSLGYNFNTNGSILKNLNLFVSGSNLLTLTKYTGVDPEVNALGLSPGFDDRLRYPSTRTFSIGLNARF